MTRISKNALAGAAGTVLIRLAFSLLLSLPVCCTAVADEIPLPPPRPLARMDQSTAADTPAAASLTSEPSACRKRLESLAEVTPIPLVKGPGACGGDDMVRLDAIRLQDQRRVSVTPPPMLRCSMAAALADWVREDVEPRVRDFGAHLRSVDNFGDYECRGRNRVAGAKLSEHGKGNAIDIRGFALDNGRAIKLTDATVSVDFRRALRTSACVRFTTVLGPGSDGYHNSHIHLDLAERHNGYRICEWELNVPAPNSTATAANVPLPVPKPDVLRLQSASPSKL
ncbi:MAG TPA: extensin family protein [Pseudolabrys sp.]|nr:extensin family protein [Pseudolabrys sp.]